MDGPLNRPAVPRTGLDGIGCDPAERWAAQHARDVRVAKRIIPICSWCRRVRDEAGTWTLAEGGLVERAGLSMTHGLCPECAQKHFPRKVAAA